jgi:hypothetical protein
VRHNCAIFFHEFRCLETASSSTSSLRVRESAKAKLATNGVFEFGFTGSPGASFIALANTNLSSSRSNWIILGTPTEISPGQFQFVDLQAPNNSRRFYSVRLSPP